jgi:hypothetical protein
MMSAGSETAAPQALEAPTILAHRHVALEGAVELLLRIDGALQAVVENWPVIAVHAV